MAELPLVGDEFAGYRLVSVLGRGGMSIVFRAENPRLGNVIALKVLDPALASDDIFRARFLEESRIAASMNHPNVIPIHDMGASDGLLYIAMRCVTGTDLRQMLKKRGRLQPETATVLLEQAARALDAAHRRGLVHRDVKPGNLLVERDNDAVDPEHVYLADFGITKQVGARTGLTSSGAFLGTIDYVAPEQIRGISVLGLADQYSLGCVLYECLTGRVPFEKDLDAAIIWAHVEESPTLPTVLRPDLPPAVDEVFARVLAKRPGDRYETCREFMAAARAALGPMAQPLPANGAPPGLLARRWLTPYPARPLDTEPAEDDWYPAEDGLYPADAEADAYSPAPTEVGDPPPLEVAASPPFEVAASRPGPEPLASDVEVPRWSPGAFDDPADSWSDEVPIPAAGPAPAPPLPPGIRRDPGWRGGRRRRWLIALAVLILVAAGAAGVRLSLAGGQSTPKAGGATTPAMRAAAHSSPAMASPKASAGMSSMTSAAATHESPRTADCTSGGRVAAAAGNMGHSGPTTLAGVLKQASLCSTPQGVLPANSCKAQNAANVTCAAPNFGVALVTFHTYAARSDLYSAYQSQVTLLDGGYRANTMTRCGTSAGYSETGWNHVEAHPTQYTVRQMESPGFSQVAAMGRQACFIAGGKPYLVWTTDVGNMLAVAQGSTSMTALYHWWADIHHVIIFRGTEMCGQNMGRMASVPQGNLISAPVCPSGVTPGM